MNPNSYKQIEKPKPCAGLVLGVKWNQQNCLQRCQTQQRTPTPTWGNVGTVSQSLRTANPSHCSMIMIIINRKFRNPDLSLQVGIIGTWIREFGFRNSLLLLECHFTFIYVPCVATLPDVLFAIILCLTLWLSFQSKSYKTFLIQTPLPLFLLHISPSGKINGGGSKLSTNWDDGILSFINWEEDYKWRKSLGERFCWGARCSYYFIKEKQRKCQPNSEVHPKGKKREEGLAKPTQANPTQCFLVQQSNDKPREGPAPRCTQLCHVSSGTRDDHVDRGSSRQDTYRQITATSNSVPVLRTPFQCRPVDSG